MGKKWGSNEGIHVGDIFACWAGPYGGQPDSDYYQVTALHGKTQVVLRPLRMERYIQEGIESGSPLDLFRERKRPLPGQIMSADELTATAHYEHGKEIRRTGVEVTAWVLPDRTAEGRTLLQEVHWRCQYTFALPEDWEPWEAETIKRMEEEARQEMENFARRFLGEDGYAGFCEERRNLP